MSLPLIVRPMRASETNIVLSAWKNQLYDLVFDPRSHTARRSAPAWGKGLRIDHFWTLINYVIDKITLPSCLVFVGCHEDEVSTPICWVVVRSIGGVSMEESLCEVLYSDASLRILKDPALAATLERELLSNVARSHISVASRRPFDPFVEMKR